MATLIGVDVGTSGTRALAVTTEGRLVAEATRPHELLTPRPGWTEQDPAEWWDACRAALAEVAAAAGDDVVGLGLAGQMHGSVFLDGGGEVIRPALLWNDQRTAAQCDEITARVGAERLLELAGNPALTGFQAPKILWLRDEEPDAYARVASVLLPKDYVRFMLTGEHATDASDASGTLLLDVRARDWSAEILDALEIPREWLPARVRGAVGDRHAARRGGRRAGAPARAAGGGGRRRQRGGGGRRRRRARGVGLDLDRHQRRAVRAPRRLHPRPLGPRPCVLPRGARRVAPDGGHAVGGRLAELVARALRRRLPGAGRRGRRGGSGGRGALVPAVPHRRAQPAPGSRMPAVLSWASPCATGART